MSCCSEPWTRRATRVAVALLVVAAAPAFAQEVPKVHIRVMISHVSSRPGPIDPAAEALGRRLKRDFKFQSVRVIQMQKLHLALNEVGSLELPTGSVLHVKPRKVSENGVLMSVEIVGTLRTSLQVKNRHQVVIGAQSYEDGKLVVSLEPEY